jgi:glycosyltransferase involved in cell wall biosynthesis
MKPPLVSVLVPTYNGARYLDAALRSVRQQTYRHLQVLVRDDGSDDGTLDIVRAYCARDRRFALVSDGAGRLGGTGNMIALLERASGEFVKFLHQDDLLATSCVERLVRPLRFDDRLTLSTSSRLRIDGDGRAVTDGNPAYQPILTQDAKLAGPELVRQSVTALMNQLGEPSVALFRNGVVPAAQAFTLDAVTYSYLNDLALWTNLLRRGDAYWHARPLSSFRIHETQRSAQLAESVTLAGEFVELVRFGVAAGLIDTDGDFARCARRVLSYVAGLSVAVRDAPTGRCELEAALAGVVQKMRVLIDQHAEAAAATHG